MLRWGFNVLAAISLVVCIASGLLWFRNLGTHDMILHAAGGQCLMMRTEERCLLIEKYQGWPTSESWHWLSGP